MFSVRVLSKSVEINFKRNIYDCKFQSCYLECSSLKHIAKVFCKVQPDMNKNKIKNISFTSSWSWVYPF